MKRFRQDLRRHRWTLLTSCVLLLLVLWGLSHGKPERLPQIEHAAFLHQGQQILITHQTRQTRLMAPVIASCPVDGGPVRELWREASENVLIGSVQITPVGCLYLVGQPPPGLKHGPVRAAARLHLVPFSGGPARELPPTLTSTWYDQSAMGASFAANWQSLYWIEGPPDSYREVRDMAHRFMYRRLVSDSSGKKETRLFIGYRSEPVLRSVLKAQTLTGGPEQILATGLSQGTGIKAGENGVFWTVSHVPPPTASQRDPMASSDLYYLRHDATQPLCLPNFGNRSDPVEEGDRLYWLESATVVSNSPQPISTQILVSLRYDGTDRREVCRVTNDAKTERTLERLTLHRGRFYVLLREVRKLSPSPWEMRCSLCRITPDKPEPLTHLRVFPSSFVSVSAFDENYCYFTSREEHENWFDWSNAGLARKIEWALYRYRLPD